MQRPQVDLAVERRLKCVYTYFLCKIKYQKSQSFCASLERGKLLRATPTPKAAGPDHSSNPSYATGTQAHQEPGYEARSTVEYIIDLISLFGKNTCKIATYSLLKVQ